VWSLPYDAHCDIVYLISNSIPVIDELSRRVVNFISSCLNAESDLVRFIIRHGILFARMASPIGRNVTYCRLRYGLGLQNVLDGKIAADYFRIRFMAGLSEHVVIQANCLFDAVTARDNPNRLPDGFLTRRELQDIVNAMCF
jgi:hypothetical protein